VEETRQSPVWVGYESEEAWHHAIDYQNRLIDIGRKLDGVLRSVQIDAFKLAKDLREFLDEMGERPDADWTGVSTSEKIAERLQERWRLQAPYESRVANGFQLRFAGRLREVMLRLGEQGADRSVILSPYLDAKNNELDIEQAAKDLENQAITISARRISDPDNDTRVKLERLPADDFKHLFIVDPSFTEWIEKRLGPRPLKKSRTKKSRTDGDDPNCSRCLWHYSNPFALGSFPSVLLSLGLFPNIDLGASDENEQEIPTRIVDRDIILSLLTQLRWRFPLNTNASGHSDRFNTVAFAFLGLTYQEFARHSQMLAVEWNSNRSRREIFNLSRRFFFPLHSINDEDQHGIADIQRQRSAAIAKRLRDLRGSTAAGEELIVW
jgi:hypothetical protein